MVSYLVEKLIPLQNNQETQALFGTHDKNLKSIEQHYCINITTRGGELKLNGDSKNVQKAAVFINSLLGSIRKKRVEKQDLMQASPVRKKNSND